MATLMTVELIRSLLEQLSQMLTRSHLSYQTSSCIPCPWWSLCPASLTYRLCIPCLIHLLLLWQMGPFFQSSRKCITSFLPSLMTQCLKFFAPGILICSIVHLIIFRSASSHSISSIPFILALHTGSLSSTARPILVLWINDNTINLTSLTQRLKFLKNPDFFSFNVHCIEIKISTSAYLIWSMLMNLHIHWNWNVQIYLFMLFNACCLESKGHDMHKDLL